MVDDIRAVYAEVLRAISADDEAFKSTFSKVGRREPLVYVCFHGEYTRGELNERDVESYLNSESVNLSVESRRNLNGKRVFLFYS